jgi:hypothetical protein
MHREENLLDCLSFHWIGIGWDRSNHPIRSSRNRKRSILVIQSVEMLLVEINKNKLSTSEKASIMQLISSILSMVSETVDTQRAYPGPILAIAVFTLSLEMLPWEISCLK